MKFFKGYCYQSFGYGAYKETYAVVVANTYQEALGMLLQQYNDTFRENWDIDELENPGVYDIASVEN